MEFVPFLVFALMNKKFMDWIRVLLPDRYEAKVLIPASAVLGVVLAFVFAASEALAGGIEIWSGQTLADADPVLVAVYGVAFAFTGGVIHDQVKPHTPPHDGT